MKIKKGAVLEVRDQRKGKYIAIATKAFDSEVEEFYPLVLAQQEPVEGITQDWLPGESIPCRKGLCTLKVLPDTEIQK